MNDKMLLAELKSIENKMDFIDGIKGDYWGERQLTKAVKYGRSTTK